MKAIMSFSVTSRAGRNYEVKIPCEVESLDGLKITHGWGAYLREKTTSGRGISLDLVEEEETDGDD